MLASIYGMILTVSPLTKCLNMAPLPKEILGNNFDVG